MLVISHRGNQEGPNPANENDPYQIVSTISGGIEVEVDVWVENGQIYLGHDKPDRVVDKTYILDISKYAWYHCKNLAALEMFNTELPNLRYFWHQEDTLTLTSQKYIWAYPGNQPIKNSIAVMPELHNDDLTSCLGICSDYIQKYKTI